jgi:hypothetical protein
MKQSIFTKNNFICGLKYHAKDMNESEQEFSRSEEV